MDIIAFPRSIKIAFLTLVFSVALFSSAFASIIEEGRGIVYGDDHAFSLKAPKGWMLDNESGVNQGVHAVFYPKGSNWKDGAIVAYARSRPKTDKIATANDAAKFVVEDFHANGSPKYEAKHIKTIKTDGGQEVFIYHFTGDQWGNSEAVAYYVEKKTINFVVLTSRNPKLFANSLSSFDALAKSYICMGDHPITDTKPEPRKQTEKKTELFETVRARAHQMGETVEGKAYEKRFSDVVAEPMQNALNDSTKDAKPPYTVNLVFMIAADGTARILFPPDQPVSALVAKKLNGIKLPAPPSPDWLVSMNIAINE